MPQNRSNAVMATRVEPPDSLDFFPTPPWATRALCQQLEQLWRPLNLCSVWEPACGQGHMALPLAGYFAEVHASDVHDYGAGEVCDFLWPGDGRAFDWIITNPPFRLAVDFALVGLERARRGVALLVRTAFLEGGERYERLFKPTPPRYILQFCERVPMLKGRLDPKSSTATSYCWLVWTKENGYVKRTPEQHWIAPCRKRLERPGDYAER